MEGKAKPLAPAGGGAATDLAGRVLNGRYRVGTLLAAGGIALVYEGHDQELDRPVAIKVLREERGGDAEFQQRLHLEARALAKLSHPNIVNLLDHGLIKGMCYLVMELVQGQTLGQLLRDEPMEGGRAVTVMRQILQTLQYAHEQGILHRDLKPGNVFLQELPHTSDHVKILDFGFAKFWTAPAQQEQAALTRVGMAVGTPAYMAPEQAAAAPMDARTDLYSAGVIMFEMLAGRRPFEGPAPTLMRDKVRFSPPKLRELVPQRGVIPEMEDWLERALARSPDDRFPDAATMIRALEALPGPVTAPQLPLALPLAREANSWLSRRHTWSVVLAGSLVLVLVGVGLAWRVTRPQEREEAAAPLEEPEGTAAAPGNPNPVVASLTSQEASLGRRLGLPDPWTGGPPPAPPLAAAHALVTAEAPVNDRLLREVRGYSRDHPEDPLSRLLLGHVFARKGRRPLALAQYELALGLDPNARGDTRMMANLVAFAARPGVGPRAARVIKQIYGPAAVEVVEAALRSPHLEAAERQRLQRLLGELSRP